MTTTSISEQVGEFNVGFTTQIGPDLSAVFDREQQDLKSTGVPVDAVAVGDIAPDARLVGLDGQIVNLSSVTSGRPAVLVSAAEPGSVLAKAARAGFDPVV